MRSTNLKGPAQTGFAPNLSPSACAALGDTIMPARSASCASSGEHDAADEASRERRIEHIGIFGQSDAQRLRLRCRRDGNEDRDGGAPHQYSHEAPGKDT